MDQIRHWFLGVLAFTALLFLAGGSVPLAVPPLAGTLILVQGDVAVHRGATEKWEAAQPKQQLRQGDAVRTGSDSRCAILCADESQIKLNEKTMLILKNVAPSPGLKPGEIIPAVPKAPPPSCVEIEEPELTAPTVPPKPYPRSR